MLSDERPEVIEGIEISLIGAKSRPNEFDAELTGKLVATFSELSIELDANPREVLAAIAALSAALIDMSGTELEDVIEGIKYSVANSPGVAGKSSIEA